MAYYRKNFRPMPEPQFPQGPENPSTATTLHFGELKFDRSFESKKTFELFKINKQALIGAALKTSTSPEVPVTEQNLRDALQPGKHFRPLFENDGPPRSCAICLVVKQPVVTTYFFRKDDVEQEGRGGNLFTRSELTIREQTPPETQEQVTNLTAEIFGGSIPEGLLSRALFVCRQCQYTVNKEAERDGKDPVFTRGFNLEQAKDRLLKTTERISVVVAENEAKNEAEDRARNIAANLGRQSRAPRNEGGQDDGYRGRREERPRKEKRDWNGVVMLELATADRADQLLAEEVIKNPEDLLNLTEEQVVSYGLVQFEEQAPHLRSIFLYAKKRKEDGDAVTRAAGTGTATLDAAAEHKRQEREREREKDNRRKKFREPRTNPKYDYNR